MKEGYPFKAAIFKTPDLFAGILSEEGKLLDANQTALDFIDRSLEDLRGEKFWNTTWWNHSEKLQKRLREGIKQAREGGTVRFDADHYSPEGQRITVDFILRPIGTKDEPARLLALGRNITARKEKEINLKKYKTVFEELTAPVMLKDTEGHYRLVNDAVTEYLGFSREEIIGKTDGELFGKEVGERMWEKEKQALDTGETITYEECLPTDKGERCFKTTRAPYYDPGGRLSGVISICRDITEQKRAEKTYREMFDNVADAIALHDPQTGRIVDVNKAACDLWGYSREEFIGLNIGEITHTEPPYTEDKAKDLLEKASLEGPQTVE